MLRSVTLGIAFSLLAAACALVEPQSGLPAGFMESFGERATFTVQPPPEGQNGLNVAAAMAAGGNAKCCGAPMFDGRVVPIFGVLDCHGDLNCAPTNVVGTEGSSRPIWVLVYPDCTDPGGTEIGWVALDGVTGEGRHGGFWWNIPCRPQP